MALEDLTDDELLLLERLLEEEERDNLLASLERIDENTSPNYKLLYESVNGQEWGLDENKKKALLKGVVGVILEGSSRSTKTWSGIFLIMYLCLIRHSKKGCTINIYRETYNEFKTTLYEDFKRILNLFGLPNKFETTTEIHQFRIGKSTINLLGDGKHGGGCDYAFFNEMMMIKQSVFDQVEMRCRIFWWGDYNPSATDHWVFDKILKRKNVAFLRTTFRENPHIAPTELTKILGYEPWQPNSYYIEDNVLMYNGAIIDEDNQPPPHPTNVDEGTADEFMWKVYGLGLRGAMKGVIFPKVKYIPEFPAHLPPAYGNDFGFVSDPNALVRYAKEGRDIYLELLLYHPIETPDALDNELTGLGISKYDPITADSSDSRVSERDGVIQMVRDLFYKGWEIRKVSKTKGVTFWLLDMKKYNIHIVENHLVKYAKIEQENYRWKEVNGILINQPIDGFNHFWDACFSGETLIETNHGLVPIKNIKAGDMVKNSFGSNKVLNVWFNGVKEINTYTLLFDTFSLSLDSTKDHKIKTDSGWIEISKLKSGMTVFLTNQTNTQKHDFVQKFVVQRIDSTNKRLENVYDLHVETNHEYIANGIVVHNCRYAHMSDDINNIGATMS